MIRGVHDSFTALPLLSVGISASLLSLLAGLLMSATNLAVQIASPILVTMLVTDLVLGLLGRAMPQMNVMSQGLSLKAVIGVVLIVLGLSQTSAVMERAILDAMQTAHAGWVGEEPR
jgi:flagellar biosynthesis protein FliR